MGKLLHGHQHHNFLNILEINTSFFFCNIFLKIFQIYRILEPVISNSMCKHLRLVSLNKFRLTVMGAMNGFLLSYGLLIMRVKFKFNLILLN